MLNIEKITLAGFAAACLCAFSAHGALWSPADISTVAWYDASDASTIMESGGNVTDWADKSGNGVHLTQAIVGDRPSVVAAGINGLNVLEFADRTEDMDAIVGGNPVLINATWVAVVLQYNRVDGSNNVDPQFSTALGSQNAANGDNYTIQYRGDVNADRWQGGYRTNGNPESTTGASAITSPAIVVHDDINLSDFRIQVGGDRGLNNRGWDGYIAEVIYGNQDLGVETELIETLEGYLAHKWGTVDALPVDHLYKSAPPIPEPGSLALMGLGGVLIARRRRG